MCVQCHILQHLFLLFVQRLERVMVEHVGQRVGHRAIFYKLLLALQYGLKGNNAQIAGLCFRNVRMGAVCLQERGGSRLDAHPHVPDNVTDDTDEQSVRVKRSALGACTEQHVHLHGTKEEELIDVETDGPVRVHGSIDGHRITLPRYGLLQLAGNVESNVLLIP